MHQGLEDSGGWDEAAALQCGKWGWGGGLRFCFLFRTQIRPDPVYLSGPIFAKEIQEGRKHCRGEPAQGWCFLLRVKGCGGGQSPGEEAAGDVEESAQEEVRAQAGNSNQQGCVQPTRPLL